MAVAVDSTAEMDTELHHNAVNILLAVYDAKDQTATTSQIGAVTGLSSANISGNHAQTLEQRGLLERAGSVESNAPRDTNVYTTTPQGNKEANRLLKQTDAEVPMSDGEKLALLNELKENRSALSQKSGSVDQDEVRSLREEVRNLREVVEETRETTEDHEEALDIIHGHLKTLFKKV